MCALLIFACFAQATIYAFVTNNGTFKLNKELFTLSFNGVTYKMVEYENRGSELSYIVCEYNNTKKLIAFDFVNDNIIEYNYIETFEWKNVAYYDKAKLISVLYRNINAYIYNNNLRDDIAVSFREYANMMIEGIKNGTITMESNGSLSDATGRFSSNGSFDKTWTGKIKNTKNNVLNLVAHYITSYIAQMPTVDSCWEQVGNPYLVLKADIIE